MTDGSQYDGDWKEGKMHGKGILKCSNGDLYEGGIMVKAY